MAGKITWQCRQTPEEITCLYCWMNFFGLQTILWFSSFVLTYQTWRGSWLSLLTRFLAFIASEACLDVEIAVVKSAARKEASSNIPRTIVRSEKEIFKSSLVAALKSVPFSFARYKSSSKAGGNHNTELRYGNHGRIFTSEMRPTLIESTTNWIVARIEIW